MRDLIDDASEKEYDMNGWDIRKALQLLRESNCSILEWINSNFCYLKNQEFVDSLRSLASKHHCRKSLIMAYWSKASKHYKDYINIENSEVILKKYLFVVQGITSAFWIIAHSPNGTDLPPQHFGALIDSLVGTSYQLPENIFTISKSLMQQKIAGQLQNGPRVAELDNWVIDSLAQIEAFTRPLEKRSRQVGMSPFNDVLLSTVTKLSGYAKIDSPSEYFFDKS